MAELGEDLSVAQTLSLIDSYEFDLGGHSAKELLRYWQKVYHVSWIRLATIEALYLGRYKAVSIEHILSVWLRLGSPNTHFTYEFERLICRKLPRHLIELQDVQVNTISKNHEVSPSETNIKESSTQSESTTTNLSVGTNESTAITPNKDNTDNTSNILENSQGNGSKSLPEPKEDLQSPTGNNPLNLKSGISLVSALRIPYQGNWSQLAAENPPIHQFIPLPDVSSFFNKLKALAQEK